MNWFCVGIEVLNLREANRGTNALKDSNFRPRKSLFVLLALNPEFWFGNTGPRSTHIGDHAPQIANDEWPNSTPAKFQFHRLWTRSLLEKYNKKGLKRKTKIIRFTMRFGLRGPMSVFHSRLPDSKAGLTASADNSASVESTKSTRRPTSPDSRHPSATGS